MKKLIISLIFLGFISPSVWGNEVYNPYKKSFNFKITKSNSNFGIYFDEPIFYRPGSQQKKRMKIGYSFNLFEYECLLKARAKIKKNKYDMYNKYNYYAGIDFEITF